MNHVRTFRAQLKCSIVIGHQICPIRVHLYPDIMTGWSKQTKSWLVHLPTPFVQTNKSNIVSIYKLRPISVLIIIGNLWLPIRVHLRKLILPHSRHLPCFLYFYILGPKAKILFFLFFVQARGVLYHS